MNQKSENVQIKKEKNQYDTSFGNLKKVNSTDN